MFQRFTERARKVVVLAQEEARRFDHGYIGTEHLLLGLLREDEGVAARTLSSLNVTLDEVREQVESIVGYGEEAVFAQAPFTPRSKKVFELALKESMQLGHNYIGTEHILLGLVRESEGVAARVLSNLDVDPDKVRREVVSRLGEEPGSDPLEEAEARTEPRGFGRLTLFRGRVEGVRVEASVPGPLPVVVDLDYSYRVGENPEGGGSTTVDPGALADLVRSSLEAADYELLEGVIETAGRLVLETFPGMRELTVTASAEPRRGEHQGFSLSATFRR